MSVLVEFGFKVHTGFECNGIVIRQVGSKQLNEKEACKSVWPEENHENGASWSWMKRKKFQPGICQKIERECHEKSFEHHTPVICHLVCFAYGVGVVSAGRDRADCV
jgi:hypothetical protein